MSRLSLISGAETLAASFHLLIDDVLLSGDTVDTEKTRHLAKLLRAAEAARDGDSSHEGLLLDSLLRDPNGRSHVHLSQLADALEKRDLSHDVCRRLSEIARRVNHERAALSTRASSW